MDKKGLLGFGLMRLPEKEGRIDIDETSRMVDLFLSSGFTYFDTAYAYGDGASEIAARDALVRRYPRSSFTLATKLCSLDTPEKMRDELRVSLERTEAGYIDYYLLHAIRRNNIEPFDNAGIWDFVKEAKEKGLIRHYGFSYHDDPGYLDEMLTLHPDVDFVQLQINYADWENPRVESRGCYEVARRHGKPVVQGRHPRQSSGRGQGALPLLRQRGVLPLLGAPLLRLSRGGPRDPLRHVEHDADGRQLPRHEGLPSLVFGRTVRAPEGPGPIFQKQGNPLHGMPLLHRRMPPGHRHPLDLPRKEPRARGRGDPGGASSLP